MLRIPEQLLQRALALGFECCSDRQRHVIRPRQSSWYLCYGKGRWVLFVSDTPQIHFSYDEVMKFLDRFDPPPPSPAADQAVSRM